VIHRDVKSSNILLDGGLAARVADFGLSRAGPELEETHVSTAVKGSFGYVDPEYVRTRKLTTKSDVYSLGVVLLEALCARPVVDPRLPKPMVNLVEWALHWQGRGELDKIVDRRIAAAVRPQALRKYGETAARCLAARGADRPAMEDVVWSLQFVMRLQDDNGLEFSDVNSLSLWIVGQARIRKKPDARRERVSLTPTSPMSMCPCEVCSGRWSMWAADEA
jgi:serine/threonine protein kinase